MGKYKPTEFKAYIDGRRVLLRALVGSQNYDLATEESDWDYKYFVCPTIDDLLNGKMVSSSNQKDENGNDIDIKDIRFLQSLIAKGNVAYLEIAYSKELKGNPFIIAFLQHYKDDFKFDNPNGFVKGLIGQSLEKLKAIEKDLPSESTNEGYARRMKYGFDGKQLMHIFRLRSLLFQSYLKENELNFQDFTPYTKKMMLGIKEAELINFHNITKNEHLTKERAIEVGKSVIQQMKNASDETIEYLKNSKLWENLSQDFTDLIHWVIKKNILFELDWKLPNNERNRTTFNCPQHLDFTNKDLEKNH